ncbi:MAG: HAD family hydrolase [Anaerolineaceae bacterium]
MDEDEKVIIGFIPVKHRENGLYYNIAMIEMTIPERKTIRVENLVCDVNGTLAVDGELIPGVAAKFEQLARQLKIHLVTADTHGKQGRIDAQLNCEAIRIKPGDEARQKLEIIRQPGAETCAAIGQGANDVLMLKEAALGICVLSDEGTCAAALAASDIVARDILSALTLLEKPQRIQATLRQ